MSLMTTRSHDGDLPLTGHVPQSRFASWDTITLNAP